MVKAKINRHVIDLFNVLRLTHQNCPYLNLSQSTCTSNILITVLMLAQYFVKRGCLLLIGGNFHPFKSFSRYNRSIAAILCVMWVEWDWTKTFIYLDMHLPML